MNKDIIKKEQRTHRRSDKTTKYIINVCHSQKIILFIVWENDVRTDLTLRNGLVEVYLKPRQMFYGPEEIFTGSFIYCHTVFIYMFLNSSKIKR